MDTITIDLPGRFVEFFEGSSIVQESREEVGRYATGGLVLRDAYEAAQKITRGKGYSYRLTFTVDADTAVVLNLLEGYAEACLAGAQDNQEYAEADAARKVINRVEHAIAKMLGAK